MKTNATITQSVGISQINNGQFEKGNSAPISRRERNALNIIYKHPGKRFVYETYSKNHPEMAMKYVKFIAQKPWVIYIRWDEKKEKFVA